MFKAGDWFVFKTGSGLKARTLQVKVVTTDGKKVRTYRAVGGEMWISVSQLRLATKAEIKLKERIEEGA